MTYWVPGIIERSKSEKDKMSLKWRLIDKVLGHIPYMEHLAAAQGIILQMLLMAGEAQDCGGGVTQEARLGAHPWRVPRLGH